MPEKNVSHWIKKISLGRFGGVQTNQNPNVRRPMIVSKVLLRDLISNHIQQENGLNEVLQMTLNAMIGNSGQADPPVWPKLTPLGWLR